jgi:DNA-binding NtrC family response regulator
MRIILIDDDSEFLKSAKDCLNHMCSFDVDLTSSVEKAAVLIKNESYDAIVCDIQMPGISGFDFLKELRDCGNLIPFIVFTNTDDSQTALKSFRLGANGFVGKYGKSEVVFSTLIKCIDECIEKQKKKECLDVI